MAILQPITARAFLIKAKSFGKYFQYTPKYIDIMGMFLSPFMIARNRQIDRLDFILKTSTLVIKICKSYIMYHIS